MWQNVLSIMHILSTYSLQGPPTCVHAIEDYLEPNTQYFSRPLLHCVWPECHTRIYCTPHNIICLLQLVSQLAPIRANSPKSKNRCAPLPYRMGQLFWIYIYGGRHPQSQSKLWSVKMFSPILPSVPSIRHDGCRRTLHGTQSIKILWLRADMCPHNNVFRR